MIKFESTRSSTVAEQEALFRSLVEAVAENRTTKFEFIKNFDEWRLMCASRSGLKKVIELFDTISESLYKTYCKQVEGGTSDFKLLCTYRRYIECRNFYKAELAVAEDMNDEYWAYIKAGNFIRQFIFGYQREAYELYDFRGKRE